LTESYNAQNEAVIDNILYRDEIDIPDYEDDSKLNRGLQGKSRSKSITKEETYEYLGKKYNVNNKGTGLYPHILNPILEQFNICYQRWKRVLVVRFDLHQPEYTNTNECITAFRKRLVSRLKYHYKFKEVGFAWVREQERAKAQHYHFVLFLDGDVVRTSKKVSEIIKQAWEKEGRTVYFPENRYYFVNNEEIEQEAVYRISYLAKPRGKGYRGKHASDYQTSRLK